MNKISILNIVNYVSNGHITADYIEKNAACIGTIKLGYLRIKKMLLEKSQRLKNSFPTFYYHFMLFKK